MAQYDQTKWFGVKPTVRTARTSAAKVAIGLASTEIVDAEDARTSILLRNTSAVDVYLNFGGAATTDDMTLEPGDVVFCDDYTGAINGIVAAGAGEIRVIEV